MKKTISIEITVVWFFRFSDRGRDLCIQYTEWNPLAPFFEDNSIVTANLRMENEIWGIGNFTGIVVVNKVFIDGLYIIQF